MKTNPKILCIGACHWDLTLQCNSKVILGESNPVLSTHSYGGVAFNIARALTHLGCIGGLASRVGSDQSGSALIDCLAVSQIEVADVSIEAANPTAAYTEVVDLRGNIVLGLADMEIYDFLDHQYWSSRVDKLAGWDAWCLDTNLPETGIKYLATLPNRPCLYGVVSSPTKGARFKSSFRHINTLILNITEASVLTDQSLSGTQGAEQAARLLCAAGVDRAIVTSGADGAGWADDSGSGRLAAPPAQSHQPIRVSGAGDSLAAATIVALEKNYSTAAAVELGIRASYLFMHSAAPEAPITWRLITEQNSNSHG